jgi:Flp pilus assembly protein TadD
MPRTSLTLGVLAMSALLGGTALASSPEPDSTAVTMNQSLEASLRDAQLKRTAHDYAGAVRILSQLMLVAADDPRVVGEYGKVLVQQGRSREALDFLDRAVQLQQNDWTLYSALGVAYDQTGDYKSAQAAYDQALALKPGDTVVLNNYAMSRALSGDLPEAKRLIAQAAAGTKDERIARNLQMINGLKPKLAQQTPTARPAQVARTAPVQTRSLSGPPPKAASGIPHPLTQPRTITAQEGRRVVMQAVPADPLAGPVAAKKTVRKVASNGAAPAKKRSAKADTSGIPDLRLANDRQ